MATLAYEKLINFFKSVGHERLDGLDSTYFEGMTEQEKKKSYDFLIEKFRNGSSEAVDGLQALVGSKVYEIFLDRITELRKTNSITEQRLSLSVSLWLLSNDLQYQDDMIKMLEHRNEYVRASALSALEKTPTTSKLIDRLERICYEDTADLIVQASAQQLLKRYGFSLKDKDKADIYRSMYRQLKSKNIDEKKLALSTLKETKQM
jgi:hypothetical protein